MSRWQARPTPAEAVAMLEEEAVRRTVGPVGADEHRYSCLRCGAHGPVPSRIPHRQTCPVRVLRDATRTGDGIYSHTDGEVRGMVWDAINRPLGVVPDSCAEVYAECLRAERER